MIKSTFINLPKEKQNKIIDAVIQEFSNPLCGKISINNIIKSAKISRGSFYQYFDDKVDLIEILVQCFMKKTISIVDEIISKAGNDIFTTYKNLFNTTVSFTDDKKQRALIKNLLNNIKANQNLVDDYLINQFNKSCHITNLSQKFSRSNLKFKSDEDVEYLINILSTVFEKSLFKILVNNENKFEVIKSFNRKLEIIESGAIV